MSRFFAAEASTEGDRVTPLELFFDLVFVFAFHQVSAIVTHGEDAWAPLQAAVTLMLVWWSWTSYAWLANQSRASVGVVRLGLIVATALMFLVALAIPESWHDLEGGMSGPVVFVVCYLLVRVVHAVVYLVAAGSDAGVRRQVIVSVGGGLTPAAVLLVGGALAGGDVQLWLWAAAVVVDYAIVYATSRGGNRWRLKSASHFAERHGLVVILALGESVIAIGIVAARVPVDTAVLGGALLAIALALGLWWSYFHHLQSKVEHELGRRAGSDRAELAVDVYTYLHLLLVAGIVLVAVGIEEAMLEIASPEPVGLRAAVYLGGGIALYLAGTVVLWLRASGEWTLPRTGGAIVCVAVIPLLAVVPALDALAILAAIVGVLLVVEQGLRGRAALRRLRA